MPTRRKDASRGPAMAGEDAILCWKRIKTTLKAHDIQIKEFLGWVKIPDRTWSRWKTGIGFPQTLLIIVNGGLFDAWVKQKAQAKAAAKRREETAKPTEQTTASLAWPEDNDAVKH
jgi:hypothetical protein